MQRGPQPAALIGLPWAAVMLSEYSGKNSVRSKTETMFPLKLLSANMTVFDVSSKTTGPPDCSYVPRSSYEDPFTAAPDVAKIVLPSAMMFTLNPVIIESAEFSTDIPADVMLNVYSV